MKPNIRCFAFSIDDKHYYFFQGRGTLAFVEEPFFLEYNNDPNYLEDISGAIIKDLIGEKTIYDMPGLSILKPSLDLVERLERTIQEKDHYELFETLKEIEDSK
jgi:hypothetical protein